MDCPKCLKEFEACYLCRGQYTHQRCVNDEMCHDCFMINKWCEYNQEIVEAQKVAQNKNS